MGILPTVRIIGLNGKPVVINKSDYHPNIDKLVHQEPAEQEKPVEEIKIKPKLGRPPGKKKADK